MKNGVVTMKWWGEEREKVNKEREREEDGRTVRVYSENTLQWHRDQTRESLLYAPIASAMRCLAVGEHLPCVHRIQLADRGVSPR